MTEVHAVEINLQIFMMMLIYDIKLVISCL